MEIIGRVKEIVPCGMGLPNKVDVAIEVLNEVNLPIFEMILTTREFEFTKGSKVKITIKEVSEWQERKQKERNEDRNQKKNIFHSTKKDSVNSASCKKSATH